MTTSEKLLMSGNEAIAAGASDFGITFACAYPGTPSTEILETIAKEKKIKAQWAPNEKVALEVGIGASVAGARVLVTMKHVGLNVAADPLMTLSYTGVKGGMVIVSADDPGMHSSQNEQDNRHFAVFAKIPMLEPSDSQEAYDYVGEALRLSEKYDTPILFRITTRIAHSKGVVTRKKPLVLNRNIEFEKDIQKYVMVPGYARARHTVVEKRQSAMGLYAEESDLNRFEPGGNGSRSGVITSGVSYQYVKETIPDNWSVLKLGLTNPLPVNRIKEFAGKHENLWVVEELDPYLENQIKALGIKVTGKDRLPIEGEFTPEIVRKSLTGIKIKHIEAPKEHLPNRPPVLCPGCSHRGVFEILRKLKLNVMGDIGCYTLGALPPLSAMDLCVCMGAGVNAAFGIQQVEKAEAKRKTVAVIGDSTFLHSGITGLLNIVYNSGNTVVIIMDNATTAMTGGQEHPASGKTLEGGSAPKVDFAALAKSLGVENVAVVDPYNLDETEKAIKNALEVPGPAVVITKAPCVFLQDKSTFTTVAIDYGECSTCKLCLNIGCPGIEFDPEAGEKGTIIINENLCIGCSVCEQVCPRDAIGEVTGV